MPTDDLSPYPCPSPYPDVSPYPDGLPLYSSLCRGLRGAGGEGMTLGLAAIPNRDRGVSR